MEIKKSNYLSGWAMLASGLVLYALIGGIQSYDPDALQLVGWLAVLSGMILGKIFPKNNRS